jgi:hypothetical protein
MSTWHGAFAVSDASGFVMKWQDDLYGKYRATETRPKFNRLVA